MKIYHLTTTLVNLEYPPLTTCIHGKFLEKRIIVDSVISDEKLKQVDYTYMREKYGFSISQEEIRIYLAHQEAWNDFLNSCEEFCLIIEENARLNQSIDTILEGIAGLKDDCDLFFPFDKGTSIGNKPYQLGFYWGSSVYILTRKGAKKLNSLEKIKQPVDEQILDLALHSKLDLYVEDTKWFDIDSDNSIVHKGRVAEVEKIINGYNVWLPPARNLVRKIIRILSEVSNKNNIMLILHGGSLLGAIQHDEIIPWDDDVDVGISENDFPHFKSLVETDGRLRMMEIVEERTAVKFYKVWLEEGEPIENQSYKFPFADIWLYKKQNNDILFHNGFLFPNAFKYQFSDIIFEGSRIWIPGNSLECLDSMYKYWRRKFIIYTWSHRLEKVAIKPFQVLIKTDDSGKFVDYDVI